MSPCLFNLYAEFIRRYARLNEAQAGINTARRNINNLRYADNTILMAGREEELKKSFLMRVKRLAYNSTFKKLRLWYPVPSFHSTQMRKKWKQ